MAWQYGVAQTVAVTFYSAGEPTAPTGALSATISKDGGAFAAIGGTVTQIGATACALLSLAIADTTCDAGVVKITDAGGTADDRYVEFTTEADYTATRAGYIDAAITSREASGAAAAAVGGLHDFDPTSETVDVGAVAGASVVGVNDFKADVSGLALTGEAASAVGTLNDLSAADVEDAVWDAATADHTDAGSMGVAVSSAEDPWSTALPGLYSAGTAGKLIGDNLDAKISTRSTLTAAQVWAAGSRTLTGFGTLVADVATAVWTAVARTITGGTVTTVGDKTGYALTAAYDAAQTAAQAADLATVAADVLRTLGLAQENQHIDNVTTDIYGRMTSARMRTYSAAGSVGTDSDVLATYTITATYTGAEEAPTTYSVVRV